MENGVEELIRSQIKCQEQSMAVVQSLKEHTEKLNDNIEKLNDQFILHQNLSEKDSEEIKAIKLILLGYLKWAVIALVVAVGGAAVIDKLGIL